MISVSRILLVAVISFAAACGEVVSEQYIELDPRMTYDKKLEAAAQIVKELLEAHFPATIVNPERQHHTADHVAAALQKVVVQPAYRTDPSSSALYLTCIVREEERAKREKLMQACKRTLIEKLAAHKIDWRPVAP